MTFEKLLDSAIYEISLQKRECEREIEALDLARKKLLRLRKEIGRTKEKQ